MSKTPEVFLSCLVSDIIITRKPKELVDLVTTSRTVLTSFAKAKTAKLGMAHSHSLSRAISI